MIIQIVFGKRGLTPAQEELRRRMEYGVWRRRAAAAIDSGCKKEMAKVEAEHEYVGQIQE